LRRRSSENRAIIIILVVGVPMVEKPPELSTEKAFSLI
jgi:hypothetical protein